MFVNVRKTAKALIVTAIMLVTSTAPAMAVLPSFTDPYSYTWTNPQFYSYIPPGQCLVTAAQSEIVGAGGPCGSGGVATAPTVQTFLSGSGVYVTPAGVRWIRVLAVGAGGGAAGAGAGPTPGGNGGDTTFGSALIDAGGGLGSAPSSGFGGAGGIATLAPGPMGYALNGAYGVPASPASGTGGGGGNTCLGGAGGGSGAGFAGMGMAGTPNTGGGGGGSSGSSESNGGGSGACINVIIGTPAPTYAYSVGAGGAGGTGGDFPGGAGAAGILTVEEHYNF